MPVLKLESIGKEKAWAIWHVTETEKWLTSEALQACPDEIIFPQKRLEWLAGRALIRRLAESCGLKYEGLTKDEFGKPFLKSHKHQISLSHSYPYVAAQIDGTKSVGIDLEQPKEKLRKVAPRLFSKSEVEDAQNDLTKLCIYWCAKEAMYKVYGKRNLLFTDHLIVDPFHLSDSGRIHGSISLPGDITSVHLQYVVTKDFVVVYTLS